MELHIAKYKESTTFSRTTNLKRRRMMLAIQRSTSMEIFLEVRTQISHPSYSAHSSIGFLLNLTLFLVNPFNLTRLQVECSKQILSAPHGERTRINVTCFQSKLPEPLDSEIPSIISDGILSLSNSRYLKRRKII